MRTLATLVLLSLPVTAHAQDRGPILAEITEAHILPRFANLSESADSLASTAQADCLPGSSDLRAAYGAAFDSWVSASHLRFGPTETGDRAFALAFWPDTKGFTPKTLSRMIADADASVGDAEAFSQVSIAGRGFFALERMLYDPDFADQGQAAYRCALIQAIAADIARNADAINADWQGYAALIMHPGDGSPYRSGDEAMQEHYRALTTGLEFTADTRLGRPLGTFDRPRPNRAEARRSERSLRHVELSLAALKDLALRLSADHPEIASRLSQAFDAAANRAHALDDPTFAGAATPQSRLRIEALQQSINDIRSIVSTELGPTLGISAGFNSLDGD